MKLKNNIYVKRIIEAVKWRTKGIFYFGKFFKRIGKKRNATPIKSRLLIFVIHEKQAKLQGYKLFLLKKIVELVDESLIIINGTLPQKEIQILETLGTVKVRKNEGYDASAFKYALNVLGKQKIRGFDEVILMNDTNIGPFTEFQDMFKVMEQKRLDFWGITYGEKQKDQTDLNPFGYIPKHIQTYFLVIQKSVLLDDDFFEYWNNLPKIMNREQAIGYHETFFTKYFENLGYRHDVFIKDNKKSAMYLHPLKIIKQGSPVIKYSAFNYFDNKKLKDQGYNFQSEIPALVKYIQENTDYPMELIFEIQEVLNDE